MGTHFSPTVQRKLSQRDAATADSQPLLKRPRVGSLNEEMLSPTEMSPVPNNEVLVLDEEQHVVLHNNYQNIRTKLRLALANNKFTRLPFILKFFTKQENSPEPDTLDLLADCIEKSGGATEKSAEFRDTASKLRGDSRYYTEGDGDPIESLKNAIGSTDGDYDLITTDIGSEPRFGVPYFKKMVLSDGKCCNHLVINLRIQLEVCPDLSLGVDEICTEASELCDEAAGPKEKEPKEQRLKRVSAFRGFRKLRELVKQAQENRVSHQSSDDELFDGLSAQKKLFDLVMNPEGTHELFLSPQKSPPKYEIVSHEDGTVGFNCTVRLDISRWISVPLDNVFTGNASRKYPVKMRAEVRRQRIAKVRSLAAKQVLEKIENTSQIIRTHAQRTLKRTVKRLLNDFRNLNGHPIYPSTFSRVADLICSKRGGDMFGYKLNVFGSMPTELALDGSDLDMNITLPIEKYLKSPDDEDKNGEGKPGGGDVYPKDVAKSVLMNLRACISRGGMSNVQCITSARVPLLKFTDPETNIDVDLTVSNLDGALQSRLLRAHLRVDPRIWELAVLVRYWAKRRNVSGLTAGFINPLGWTVMVIYFMQHIAFPSIGTLFHVHNSESTKAARESVIERVRWDSSTMDGVNTLETYQLLKLFFREFSDFPFGERVISLNAQIPKEKKAYAQNSELGRACPITIEQPLLKNRNIVGYVSESCMKETKNQMRSASFRMENVGREDVCFTERIDP